MKARISEVFESMQGEGLYLGDKQLFVRFFGCNLNCKFCDTKLNHFMEYEPQELLEEIRLYKNITNCLAFTGGEPLLQKDFLKEIMKITAKEGYKHYLETNGTLPGELEEVIDLVDIVAMDVKLPSSTGMGNLWNLHRRFLEISSRKEVFIKAVICQDTQEGDLKEALNLINAVNRATVLVLQPNSYENNGQLTEKLRNLRDICIKEKVTTCIIPQMHKITGIK